MRGTAHFFFGAAIGLYLGGHFDSYLSGAIVGGIAALLPDIDHPYSPIGKLTQPLSFWINETFGHRELIHTVWSCIAFSAILVLLSAILNAFFGSFFSWPSSWVVFICSLSGALSHLILDAFNPTGISPWFPLELKGEWTHFNHFSSVIRTGDPIEVVIAIISILAISLKIFF